MVPTPVQILKIRLSMNPVRSDAIPIWSAVACHRFSAGVAWPLAPLARSKAVTSPPVGRQKYLPNKLRTSKRFRPSAQGSPRRGPPWEIRSPIIHQPQRGCVRPNGGDSPRPGMTKPRWGFMTRVSHPQGRSAPRPNPGLRDGIPLGFSRPRTSKLRPVAPVTRSRPLIGSHRRSAATRGRLAARCESRSAKRRQAAALQTSPPRHRDRRHATPGSGSQCAIREPSRLSMNPAPAQGPGAGLLPSCRMGAPRARSLQVRDPPALVMAVGCA